MMNSNNKKNMQAMRVNVSAPYINNKQNLLLLLVK